MSLGLLDHILHFSHRSETNRRLRQLFDTFRPLAIYKAQLLVEKEITIVKLLLLARRRQQDDLTINDLNRYLDPYPIPCRLSVPFIFIRAAPPHFHVEMWSTSYGG